MLRNRSSPLTLLAPDGDKDEPVFGWRGGAVPSTSRDGMVPGLRQRGRRGCRGRRLSAGWTMRRRPADGVGFRDIHDMLFHAEASPFRGVSAPPDRAWRTRVADARRLHSCRPVWTLLRASSPTPPLRNPPKTATNKGCATATSPRGFACWDGLASGTTADVGDELTSDLNYYCCCSRDPASLWLIHRLGVPHTRWG